MTPTSSPEGTLLFLTPRVGDLSETFVSAHIDHLAPGATTILTRQIVEPVDGPAVVHVVDQRRGRKRWRDGIARRYPWVRSVRPRDWSPSRRAWRRFDDALDGQPDAVFIEYLDQFTRFAERAAARGVPVLMQAHGYDISTRLRDDYWRGRYSELGQRPGIDFVANSGHARDVLVSVGVPLDRVHVVPNAVPDLQHLASPPRAHRCDLRLVALGRLVAKKDLRPVLRAMHRVRIDGMDVRLTVVGGGPLRREYEELAVTLGIGGHVDLVGPASHSDALRYLASADVFVQHSATDPDTGDTEGLPIAVLEAMSMSKPVISTLHAGIPEAVDADRTGVLVAEHDVDGLSAAIARLYAEPWTVREMGAAGRERWSREFTQDRQISDLRALLFGRSPS